jgi:hypothetical protein
MMEICPECEWPLPSWWTLQKHRYVRHGKLASGKTLSDGTYEWQCNKCEGNPECDWCYALDMARIVEEMNKGARGQRYYALLKAFLSINGKAIHDFAISLKEQRGSLRVIDLGYVALNFDLNFKATVEWLEETHVIRAGAYSQISRSKLKVADILAAAHDEYEVA